MQVDLTNLDVDKTDLHYLVSEKMHVHAKRSNSLISNSNWNSFEISAQCSTE